jgi:hypothetical protein
LSLEDRTLPSTFLVTNLLDGGNGSLRQAVLNANANPGPDDVAFAPGLQGTVALTSGPLDITDALTIHGPGADQLTVSGTDHSRVFDVRAGVTVTLSGLTVAHGRAATGGGIDNAGTLTLRDSIVADNQAVGGLGGGGILNEVGASLTLDRCALTDNQATAAIPTVTQPTVDVFGGGLLNQGRATVTSSTFRATGP